MKIIKETNTYCILETLLNAEELNYLFNNSCISAKAYYTNVGGQKRIEYEPINYRTVMYYIDRW